MSRYDYDEWRDREPFELMRKVERLDASLRVAERTLSELRAVDACYDDLDAMVLVFADASCEPGESFAVAIERVERGLSEPEARAEVRAQHATPGPHEPFGALVPRDAADLILVPALSAEEMALVRVWLAEPGTRARVPRTTARLIMMTADALVMTIVSEAEPSFHREDRCRPFARPRSPILLPRMPERVTGDRAPDSAGRLSYSHRSRRSLFGELLVRADVFMEAARHWPDWPEPRVLVMANADSEPGMSLAAAVLSGEKNLTRGDAHAQIKALVEPWGRPPVVFGRFLRVPLATFLLAERLGEDIGGALAMWLEKVRPDETPIIAIGHSHLTLARERTRTRA